VVINGLQLRALLKLWNSTPYLYDYWPYEKQSAGSIRFYLSIYFGCHRQVFNFYVINILTVYTLRYYSYESDCNA